MYTKTSFIARVVSMDRSSILAIQYTSAGNLCAYQFIETCWSLSLMFHGLIKHMAHNHLALHVRYARNQSHQRNTWGLYVGTWEETDLEVAIIRYTECLILIFTGLALTFMQHMVYNPSRWTVIRLCKELNIFILRYRKISNIRRTQSHNVYDSHLILKSSLRNPLKPGVTSRMKM